MSAPAHVNGKATNGASRRKPAAKGDSILDRQPPFDLQAERGVLGSVFCNRKMIDQALSIVRPGDFYDDANRMIFAAMESLHRDGVPVDPTLVLSRLKTAEQLEQIGGLSYLKSVVDATPNEAHTTYYAELVRDQSQRRQIIVRATEMLDQAFRELPPLDILGAVEDLTAELRSTDTANAPLSLGQLEDRYTKLREPVINGLLRTGETLNLISASKIGKSWLTYYLALCVITGKRIWERFLPVPGKVLLIDNELHRETIAYRVPKVAAALGIEPKEYRDGLYIESFRGRLQDINKLGSYLLQFKRGEFKLIIIDAFYRTLPRGTDENDNGAVAHLYNTIDSYADRLGCAFALVHHASKGNQSNKAAIDVGAGAGSMSRAVDTHLVLRPHQEQGAVIVDAAVRSWEPIDPFCLRFEFPIWTPAEDLDPEAMREGKKRPEEKPTVLVRTIAAVLDLIRAKGPLTKSDIKTEIRASGTTVKEAIDTLLERGEIEPFSITKGKQSYPGFRAACLNSRTDQDSPGQSGQSDQDRRGPCKGTRPSPGPGAQSGQVLSGFEEEKSQAASEF